MIGISLDGVFETMSQGARYHLSRFPIVQFASLYKDGENGRMRLHLSAR